MTLQSSGAISLADVRTELGASGAISLGDTNVRNLAGVASGAISLSNLYGKSNGATFTPNGGTTSSSPVALESIATYPGSARKTIDCSATATWTWTKSGATQATASIASGGTGTSITFTLNSTNVSPRTATFTVSATSGSVTRYWTVTLTTETTQ